MLTYLFKRLLLIIPTFFGIILITFAVVHLAPGDPAELKLQSSMQGMTAGKAATQIVEDTRKLYGLDKPLPTQFALWVKRVATFDFGTSYKDHQPVLKKIAQTLPITLALNIITLLIVYLVSIPWGILSAVKPVGWFDRVSAVFLYVLYSLP